MMRATGCALMVWVAANAMPLAYSQNSRAVEVLPAQQAEQAAHTITLDEYRVQNAAMQTRIQACKESAAACDSAGFATRLTVPQAGRQTVSLREGWLVDALTAARTESDAERGELMTKAAERLREEEAELMAQPAQGVDGAKARHDADQILARREFQYVQQETWLTRRWALFMMGVTALMSSLFGGLPSAPWTVPLVEGGFLLAAAVGLVMWAWRTTQQQRVALSTSLSISNAGWQRESNDWARRAEEEAAAGAWREAVHCLYWAAIVMLEGKRLWRANRARTPREYLPLLESGSAVRTTLGGLTRIFERIWYGLRPATKADYEQAQALLETLKAGG